MDLLFVGIKGHVIAINKGDGSEVWRTKLKSANITVVSSDHTRIYAAASGHLFCLDKATGEQIWTNSLKGLGYGTCIIDVGNHAAPVSGIVASNVAAAASSAAATAAIAASGTTSAGDGG